MLQLLGQGWADEFALFIKQSNGVATKDIARRCLRWLSASCLVQISWQYIFAGQPAQPSSVILSKKNILQLKAENMLLHWPSAQHSLLLSCHLPAPITALHSHSSTLPLYFAFLHFLCLYLWDATLGPGPPTAFCVEKLSVWLLHCFACCCWCFTTPSKLKLLHSVAAQRPAQDPALNEKVRASLLTLNT